MSTLGEVITKIDALVENSFSDDQKTSWINELESKIWTEILLISEADYVTLSFATHENTELKVDAAHEEIYESWLTAQIYKWQHEVAEYNFFIQQYNAQWDNYSAFIAFFYAPADFRDAVDGLYYLRPTGSVLVCEPVTINYSSTSGAQYLVVSVPSDCLITKVVVDVTQVFNSSTSDVIIVGTAADDNKYLTTADVTATTVGAYSKEFWEATGNSGTDVYVKWTGTGDAATTGSADVYVQYVYQA